VYRSSFFEILAKLPDNETGTCRLRIPLHPDRCFLGTPPSGKGLGPPLHPPRAAGLSCRNFLITSFSSFFGTVVRSCSRFFCPVIRPSDRSLARGPYPRSNGDVFNSVRWSRRLPDIPIVLFFFFFFFFFSRVDSGMELAFFFSGPDIIR